MCRSEEYRLAILANWSVGIAIPIMIEIITFLSESDVRVLRSASREFYAIATGHYIQFLPKRIDLGWFLRIHTKLRLPIGKVRLASHVSSTLDFLNPQDVMTRISRIDIRTEYIRGLIAWGADVNAIARVRTCSLTCNIGETVVEIFASSNRSAHICRLLIIAGAKITDNLLANLIIVYPSCTNKPLIMTLIRHVIALGAKLHSSIMHNKVDTLDWDEKDFAFAIGFGLDINYPDEYGNTILDVVIEAQCYEFAETLVSRFGAKHRSSKVEYPNSE